MKLCYNQRAQVKMRFSVTWKWEKCLQNTHSIKRLYIHTHIHACIHTYRDNFIAEASQDPSSLFWRDVHLSSLWMNYHHHWSLEEYKFKAQGGLTSPGGPLSKTKVSGCAARNLRGRKGIPHNLIHMWSYPVECLALGHGMASSGTMVRMGSISQRPVRHRGWVQESPVL